MKRDDDDDERTRERKRVASGYLKAHDLGPLCDLEIAAVAAKKAVKAIAAQLNESLSRLDAATVESEEVKEMRANCDAAIVAIDAILDAHRAGVA